MTPMNSSQKSSAPANRRRLLLVDDDADLRQLLSSYLTRNGFDVLMLPDTTQLDAYLERYSPHLVILDLMMPGEDGLAACRRLRAGGSRASVSHRPGENARSGIGESVPIIMLTARDEPIDRIVGLEMGADDYLGKPFEARELLARVEAVLRRNPTTPFDGACKPFHFGPFCCDFETRELRRDGAPVNLTGGEFNLLSVFIRHANRPLKRERLMELTRGNDSDSLDRAIDMQIYRLRRVIESDPSHPRYIRPVWGLGYMFVPSGESSEKRADPMHVDVQQESLKGQHA